MLVKKNVNLKCCCYQSTIIYPLQNGLESLGITNVTRKFWDCTEYQRSLLRHKRSNNKLKSYNSSEDSRIWSGNKDDARRAILAVTQTYETINLFPTTLLLSKICRGYSDKDLDELIEEIRCIEELLLKYNKFIIEMETEIERQESCGHMCNCFNDDKGKLMVIEELNCKVKSIKDELKMCCLDKCELEMKIEELKKIENQIMNLINNDHCCQIDVSKKGYEELKTRVSELKKQICRCYQAKQEIKNALCKQKTKGRGLNENCGCSPTKVRLKEGIDKCSFRNKVTGLKAEIETLTAMIKNMEFRECGPSYCPSKRRKLISNEKRSPKLGPSCCHSSNVQLSSKQHHSPQDNVDGGTHCECCLCNTECDCHSRASRYPTDIKDIHHGGQNPSNIHESDQYTGSGQDPYVSIANSESKYSGSFKMAEDLQHSPKRRTEPPQPRHTESLKREPSDPYFIKPPELCCSFSESGDLDPCQDTPAPVKSASSAIKNLRREIYKLHYILVSQKPCECMKIDTQTVLDLKAAMDKLEENWSKEMGDSSKITKLTQKYLAQKDCMDCLKVKLQQVTNDRDALKDEIQKICMKKSCANVSSLQEKLISFPSEMSKLALLEDRMKCIQVERDKLLSKLQEVEMVARNKDAEMCNLKNEIDKQQEKIKYLLKMLNTSKINNNCDFNSPISAPECLEEKLKGVLDKYFQQEKIIASQNKCLHEQQKYICEQEKTKKCLSVKVKEIMRQQIDLLKERDRLQCEIKQLNCS